MGTGRKSSTGYVRKRDVRGMADDIWRHPEKPAFRERRASRLQAALPRSSRRSRAMGSRGHGDAFVAEWGKGTAVLGLLGSTTRWRVCRRSVSRPREPEVGAATGHGCGLQLREPRASLRPPRCAGARGTASAGTVRYYAARRRNR